MKEGWKMVKLGEVCEIRPSRSQNFKKLKDTDNVSFLPMEDLGVYDRVINASKTKILKEISGSYTYFENGDVLLAKVTPCFENGKLGIAYNLINGIGFGSSEYIVFRPNHIISSEFVYYNLANAKFREGGKRLMLGACGLKRLSKDYINNYEIPLPPLEEQHRIVGILDAAFAKIDALKKNAEENLKNAKALFQQVLAQELKPKVGWVEKKLGEICSKIGSGATPHGGKDSYKEEGISLIRSLNVYDNEFIYDDLAHIDDKQADELNNVIIEKNDVLFNITGASVTRCCIVPNKILPARVNQHVSILRPQNGVLTNVFLCYLMISMKDYLIKLAFSKGATRQAITKKQLEDLMIAYPNDINEQMSIVNTINTLSEKCRRLEEVAQQTIRECDALKQSILRQAFSGEL